MNTPHYLRFVQALVLAASVPACAADSEPPSPSETAPAERQAQIPESAPEVDAPAEPASPATAEPSQVADAGEPAEEVDAGLPFSSGPIVPPELPARRA